MSYAEYKEGYRADTTLPLRNMNSTQTQMTSIPEVFKAYHHFTMPQNTRMGRAKVGQGVGEGVI
ncbi:hypothetical protein E2C01_004112 [Portunus trituberculatus]|uniref:Uncharacterized protein n=1 Tax=Portunus trituberculatus TaxID=210409 RepID=A0A5B7CQH9_PORTR|nr:hypothetical protein [Portunus trituberculatus]